MTENLQQRTIVEMEGELQGYKTNMKIFVQHVEQEVANLIKNY